MKAIAYHKPGVFFITISASKHIWVFGDFVKGTMRLSQIGLLADKYLNEIKYHFPYINIHEYVIMPNHIHILIEIKSTYELKAKVIRINRSSLASIIGSYKASVSRKAKEYNSDFKWNRGYYDRLILTKQEFLKAKYYIINNPRKWLIKYQDHYNN